MHLLAFRQLGRLVPALATLVVMLAAGPQGAAQERILLSEFMAANVRTLADRDRDYSDWIELHNAGAAAVNLDGWFLTDDRADLKKWRLPAVPLAAGEYLLVFASGKDRRAPGAELHANFKLDAERGYLGLVKPDGATVAAEFAPEYPRQVAGASFGLDMADKPAPLLTPTASKRLHVPTADLGLKWAAPEFDDSSWLSVTDGVGFGASANAAAPAETTLRGRMLGKNASVYVRVPFDVADPSFETLRLRLRYEDGFIAYLNGWEVARRNAPARAQWNSAATAAPAAPAPNVLAENFDAATGPYVTAQADPNTRPKVFLAESNGTRGSLRLVNGRVNDQINSIAFPQTAPGLFETVVAAFDFRWKGSGDGTTRLAFMLIPVAQYGAAGAGVDLAAFNESRDPKLPGAFAVQLLHNVQTGGKALTLHWDRLKRATADLPAAAFGQRVMHRAQVRLQHTDQGALISVTLISDAYGPQKQTFTPIPQTLIPGLRPYQSRVQFVGRIGNWDQTLDLDNLRVEFLGAGAQAAEDLDLSSFINVLRPGRNVLALHGLNNAPNDPSFLLAPELAAGFGAIRSKETRYFATPTPRAGNRDGLRGLSPPPVFSKRGGVFTDAMQLELTAREGTVRYTLDGSEPHAGSQAYAEPIALTGSTLVKAKTFAQDKLPSGTATETFTFLDESAASFASNLPLLILNPFGGYLSANNRATVSLRFIDAGKGRNTLAGPADYDGRASVNIRGFSTLRQPKNSLTLRLIDENNDKVKAALFGMPKESDWVLYAPYADKTLMRDALAYELSNQMGRYAPRTRFVEVFMDRSGGRLGQRDYMGVYVLVERIKRDKNRVNIAGLTASDITEPAITGGYIFKRDHSERYEQSFRTGQGNHFYYVHPDPEDMSREQMQWLSRYVNRFEQALYGQDFRDPQRGYAAYLDVDAFIDQHWLIEMSKNIDGFRYSAYLHKDRDGKIVAGPAWDWNLSFGNADYYGASEPSGWYTHELRDSEICWFRRLSEDPEFMQRAIDRWGELRRGVLATPTVLGRVDNMAAQLHEAQARNFRRWPILGRRIHPNDFVGDTYEEEIRWMKQWIQRRLAWIDSQFLAPPALTHADGTITLRAASGKIYYTLDGSDPRQPAGGVSPKAKTYSAPIPLNSAANLFARAQHRSSWSSPALPPDRNTRRAQAASD
jgi:hypothetical protein